MLEKLRKRIIAVEAILQPCNLWHIYINILNSLHCIPDENECLTDIFFQEDFLVDGNQIVLKLWCFLCCNFLLAVTPLRWQSGPAMPFTFLFLSSPNVLVGPVMFLLSWDCKWCCMILMLQRVASANNTNWAALIFYDIQVIIFPILTTNKILQIFFTHLYIFKWNYVYPKMNMILYSS